MKTTARIKSAVLALLLGVLTYGAAPVWAQQRSDRLMQDLGFRHSGSEYLYPLSFFRYACNAKLNRAYLLVADQTLDSLHDAADSVKLAYLSGSGAAWQILLPVPGEAGSRVLISMKGKEIAEDKDWQRLAACSRIQTDGKASLKDAAQKAQLLQEALIAWQELLSWYQAGKH